MNQIQNKPNISLVLPAYNEEGNIEKVIREALSYLSQYAGKYEIIVVDDGSQDNTFTLLKDLSVQHPEIQVYQNEKNMGYGYTLRRGLANSHLDYIYLTDSDGQLKFDNQFQGSSLFEAFQNNPDIDFIQGFREERCDAGIRKINTYLWNHLLRILFRSKFKDVDCAVKFFRKEIMNKIQLKSNGAMISLELVLKSQKAGFKIQQIPVHHYPRLSGKSTGANLQVIFTAFRELFTLYSDLKS